MKKHEILKELIDLFFEFDAAKGEPEEYSLEEFTEYLNSRKNTEDLSMRKIEGDANKLTINEYRSSAGDVSILISLMFRYAKGYIKKALRNSMLQTADEFAFLITLMTFDSLSKSELITKQVMEKTSGTEIIKRLLKNGLVREFPDEHDKRSIRVSMTEKGKEEILSILPEMRKVSDIVIGNLSDAEINTLGYLLKKLDHFHNEIYLHKRKLALDDLIDEMRSY